MFKEIAFITLVDTAGISNSALMPEHHIDARKSII